MQINWATVAAVLTSGAILMAAASFGIRAIVRSELAALKDSFLTIKLADERHEEHGRRIGALEQHIFGHSK